MSEALAAGPGSGLDSVLGNGHQPVTRLVTVPQVFLRPESRADWGPSPLGPSIVFPDSESVAACRRGCPARFVSAGRRLTRSQLVRGTYLGSESPESVRVSLSQVAGVAVAAAESACPGLFVSGHQVTSTGGPEASLRPGVTQTTHNTARADTDWAEIRVTETLPTRGKAPRPGPARLDD